MRAAGKKLIQQQMILRPPHSRNMHPVTKEAQNRMTQPPKPLEFKLQDIPANQTPEKAMLPLGVNQNMPFSILRTHTGNLPVYRKFNHNRTAKRTVIRHIEGDINKFTEELSKVVSNAEIHVKVGRVEINGLHKETVDFWLKRLGF
ncbi:hypothetical protein ABPG72_020737 [Tetrahymena utriculariae]